MESARREYETVTEALAEVQTTFGPGVKLTLSEGQRIGEGPVFGTGPVYQYEVIGLPFGQHVFINNVRVSSADGGRWQILRSTDRVR
jgi:hypothetical protein